MVLLSVLLSRVATGLRSETFRTESVSARCRARLDPWSHIVHGAARFRVPVSRGPPWLPQPPAARTCSQTHSIYQIFQTLGYIAIRLEMHQETRLIPLDNAAPSEVGAPSVMGSSRGHWDGDTLVVETTNLLRGVDGSTPAVRVTERFSRVGPELLPYDYTLDDPALERARLPATTVWHRRYL